MITVTYTNILYDEELLLIESPGGFNGVTVEGHALFSGGGLAGSNAVNAPKGENIVCAAVSFSALTMLKSMSMIAGIRPDYNVNEGFLDVRINTGELDTGKKNIIRVLLESFMIGILDIKKAYPDLISIRFVDETK